MTVEISNIKNAELRHAAEVADLNDNTANSGKLDQKELSVFIKEAVNTNCDKASIAEICNQVGVEHADDDVKASMEKLNQLQKLEKELKYQKSILNKRDNEIKKLEKEDDSKNSKSKWVTFGSLAGGVAAGAAAGAAIGAAFAGVGAAPGAFLGGLVGAFGGLYTGVQINNHYFSGSNYHKIRDYEQQARPIENKISELESQMKEVQESL